MVLSRQQEQESSNVHVEQPVTANKAEVTDGMTAASDTTTSDSE